MNIKGNKVSNLAFNTVFFILNDGIQTLNENISNCLIEAS